MNPLLRRRRRLAARRAMLPLLLQDAPQAEVPTAPEECWVDWACEQGVAGFLAAHPGVLEAVGPAGREKLDRFRWDRAFRFDEACAAAGRIAAAAQRAGIELLLLKGVGLAERYYPRPQLRPVNDLDLLVHEADVDRARDLLLGLGYTEVRAGTGQLQFASGSSLPVELHWRLVNSASLHANLPESDPSLWLTAEPLALGGVPVRVPGPWEAFRTGCVHAAQHHQFSRLVWLVDLARMLRVLAREPDALAGRIASTSGGERVAITAAMRLVKALFPDGAPTPPPGPFAGRPFAAACLGALTPDAVLLPEASATRWRRKIFREALKAHA